MTLTRCLLALLGFFLLSISLICYLFELQIAVLLSLYGTILVPILIVYLYILRNPSISTKYLNSLLSNVVSDQGIDFTFRFDENDKTTPSTCLALNASLTTIEHIFQEVYNSSSRLIPMADALHDTYASMTQKATIQSAHGEDLAKIVAQTISISRELESSVEQINSSVSAATQSVQQTRLDSDESQASLLSLANNIEQTNTHMAVLKQDSDNIDSIIEVINAIAEQTNLLALNAAIEAARAGEQGRGFAVVADEVRNLAARTSNSTQEVKAMVSKIQQSTDLAHSLMNTALSEAQQTVKKSQQTSTEISTIEQAMLSINDMSQHISQQVLQQKTISDDAQESIEAMLELNCDALSSSQIQAVSSTDLRQLANSLHNKLGLFKITMAPIEPCQRTDTSRMHNASDTAPVVATCGDIELF